MADLDYAYLADFVSLQDGKLTAVGASFTFADVPSLPMQMMLGVAGRVRAHVDEGSVPIEIRVTPPNGEFTMSFTGDMKPGPNPRPYGDGMLGLLFAVNVQLPVEAPGLYLCNIFVSGSHARRLAFEIELAGAS